MQKEPTKKAAGKRNAGANPPRKLSRAEKKQIAEVIRQAKGDGKAHTAQQTIPYLTMYPDGICKVSEKKYSKSIAFEDINYQLGLVIAVAGGTLIEKLHLESYVEDFIRGGNSLDVPQEELHFKDRIKYAWEQVLATAKKVAPYVLIGVGIGAFIHDWIPEDFIVKVLGTGNPFGVILATIAGVPMYADIFGTIPIAEALLAKGAQLGVVLSFMMGVTTLSLPSVIMLRKAVKPKLLGIFIAICTIGIILIGYFFNAISYLLI